MNEYKESHWIQMKRFIAKSMVWVPDFLLIETGKLYRAPLFCIDCLSTFSGGIFFFNLKQTSLIL